MLITFRCPKISGLKLQLASLCSLKYRILFVFFIITCASTIVIYFKIIEQLKSPMSKLPGREKCYSVVIDLGSSGSRAYIYYWHIPKHGHRQDQLLDIKQLRDSDGDAYVKKITPGISTYSSRPHESTDYLGPLLQYAGASIPQQHHASSPLYVFATAGLRMLNESDRESIVSDLRRKLPTASDFQFADGHASMISGEDEAVYTWVALNHALGIFDTGYSSRDIISTDDSSSAPAHKRQPTVGIFDMGGASMQIAYEVDDNKTPPKHPSTTNNNTRTISLGCSHHSDLHTYRLHVQTFLGFGGDAARQRYEASLLRQRQQQRRQQQRQRQNIRKAMQVIHDPCLNRGNSIQKVHEDLTYTFNGTGNFSLCRENLLPLLNMNCSENSCYLDSKYRPSVNYEKTQFYALSEFLYTGRDVFNISGVYNRKNFEKRAKAHCLELWSDLQFDHRHHKFPFSTMSRLSDQCFKSAWTTGVLHYGLDYPSAGDQRLTTAQKVHGADIQWTLGALLYRTRFYPARYRGQRNLQVQDHIGGIYTGWQPSDSTSFAVLLICMSLVLFIIVAISFKVLSRRRVNLKRVNTYSYFMTDNAIPQDGLLMKKLDYFY